MCASHTISAPFLPLPNQSVFASAGLVGAYLLIEACFYFYFHFVIVPRANERRTPAPYRDYPKITDRHKLLLRVLHRLQRQADRESLPLSIVLTNFFLQWFGKDKEEHANSSRVASENTDVSTIKDDPVPRPSLIHCPASSVSETTARTSGSSSSNSSDASSISSGEDEPVTNRSHKSCWTIPGLGRPQMEEFFAWAFFAKETDDLTLGERTELDLCFRILQSQTGLVLPENVGSMYKARRLCLEDVSPLHRPLAVYFAVEVLRLSACLVLRLFGFRRVSSPDHPSLPGWYRPGRGTDDQKQKLPLVFFHGIAPAGLAFYLPLIFSMISDGRPTLLVEQPGISGRLGTFDSLAEDETMRAVEQMLQQSVDSYTETKDLPILWAGHSFGSCPLTWMLRNESLKQRTGGILLLDPVTLLLSEPAVMLNFLYSTDMSKIRIAAASEVFTEYYLRRHFAWYNSEAWVDPNANYCLTVALSGNDEIVDSPAVAAYLSDYSNSVRTIYWSNAGHAHCVTEPKKWKQVQQALWQQEDAYWQKQVQ